METFTLAVWLYIGMRYEEVQITDLDRNTCVERLHDIVSSRFVAYQQKVGGRREAKGKCVDAKGTVAPPEGRIIRECASCGLLPGRRRV